MNSATVHALVISDGVTGHLRQCEAVAGILSDLCQARGMAFTFEAYELEKFRPRQRSCLWFRLIHPGAARCLGCARCFRHAISSRDYRQLRGRRPDVVISPFGKKTASTNAWLARSAGAKSVVVMAPRSGIECFDLAIVPRHDGIPESKNVLVTEGSPNLVARFLKEQALVLRRDVGAPHRYNVGFLLGGDYKEYKTDTEIVAATVETLLETCRKLDAGLWITTSRRTPPQAEAILERALKGRPEVRLFVNARTNNRPGVVSGILGLCDAVVVSSESVSMISEAAASGAHVIVYKQPDFLTTKHENFLANLVSMNHAVWLPTSEIGASIEKAVGGIGRTVLLDETPRIAAALERNILDSLAPNAA